MPEVNAGFLLGVDKPRGMSSHDVVNVARKSLGIKRIGHMGTLDPFASGVMILGVGSAARLNQFLQFDNKMYQVTAKFGYSTNTYDCEGEVVNRRSVPPCLGDATEAQRIIKDLVGKHIQKPPVYSAIKVNGLRAYKAARSGKKIDIPSREIEVLHSSFIENDCDSWTFEVEVSKGTYIRSLVNDLGEQLGCPAHVNWLRRIKSGHTSIDDCVTFEELEKGKIRCLQLKQLLDYPSIAIDYNQLKMISNGNKLILHKQYCDKDGNICVYYESFLLAIYRLDMLNDSIFEYCPVCVFNGGIKSDY